MPDLAKSFDHVLAERRDRQAVLVPRVAVHRDGQVHLEVEPALGRGHQALLLGGHDDPLPLLPVAHHVLLDRVGVVELAVALERVAHVVEAGERLLEVGAEDAGPGVIDARTDQLSSLHLVGVGEHVGGVGLRIAHRGDAVGEIGQILPDLGLVDAEGGPGMGVDVHESGNDGLARGVDRLASPAGAVQVPTHTMRLSVTTTSPLSMTSSPFMLMIRAPLSTTVPCGTSRGERIAMSRLAGS